MAGELCSTQLLLKKNKQEIVLPESKGLVFPNSFLSYLVFERNTGWSYSPRNSANVSLSSSGWPPPSRQNKLAEKIAFTSLLYAARVQDSLATVCPGSL